jgi:hypothetical protein
MNQSTGTSLLLTQIYRPNFPKPSLSGDAKSEKRSDEPSSTPLSADFKIIGKPLSHRS